MPSERPVSLSESAARRLVDTGRYIEQQPRSKASIIDGPRDFGGATMLLTTSIITRGSGPTPGTGSGKVQKFNGTIYSDNSTTAYPILNDTTAQIKSGAYVLCLPGPGGKFHFVNTSCENIS